jgi:cytochrome c556
MYRSASNFVIVAQNASVEGDVKSYQKMLGALKEVTSACRACHQAYRVR